LEVYYLTGKTLTEHHREHAFRDVPYCSLQIGLAHERHELHRSIEKRVDRMIEDGLVEEVAALLEQGYGPELKALQGIGYRQIVEFLQGGCTLAEAVIRIKKATKRFAKRQMTWFRREDNIVWITLPDGSSLLDAEVKKFLYVD
ncbi:MAG: tRNA (adenosine(37)-N6)-dimethylallyltransferase MiaA, partial [Deltaproteobacteria bacterium]|nr:tRNA (adenosine(37)-N6)-dimethylallyltransferase MiaA [Deltaproteobacteria bacterium]